MSLIFRVCKEILTRGTDITPLKLIKIAYISHGFHLGYMSKPLFNERVEAWPYGPVIKEIYFAVNHFKREKILPNLFDHVDDNGIENKSIQVINAVLNTYNKYDGLQLSTITHQEGTPWSITIKKKGINQVIDNSLIEKHYRNIIYGNS